MEKGIDYISVLIASVYRGIQKIKQEALEEYGMNNVITMCIYAIGINPGISATEICKTALLDKAAVSKAIHQLINQGWATRPVLSKRAYRSGIYLTGDGLKIFDIVNSKLQTATEKAFKDIPEQDYDTMLQTLKAIAKNLDQSILS